MSFSSMTDAELLAEFKVAEARLDGDIYRDAPPGSDQAYYQDVIMELRYRRYIRHEDGTWEKIK